MLVGSEQGNGGGNPSPLTVGEARPSARPRPWLRRVAMVWRAWGVFHSMMVRPRSSARAHSVVVCTYGGGSAGG